MKKSRLAERPAQPSVMAQKAKAVEIDLIARKKRKEMEDSWAGGASKDDRKESSLPARKSHTFDDEPMALCFPGTGSQYLQMG